MSAPARQEPCVHEWELDNMSLARCRKCGAKRDYHKTLAEEMAEAHHNALHRQYRVKRSLAAKKVRRKEG